MSDTTAIEAEFARLEQLYRDQGMVKTVGFGERPAVVCVDLIRGFTDPAAPTGLDTLGDAVTGSRTVLDAARGAGATVVLVGSGYDPAFREGGAWERKVSHEGLVHGSEWVEFDAGLGQVPSDLVVMKRYASSFFETPLTSLLVSSGVDTVIVTGAATSGCVRATAIDAMQSGFRTIVVRDAVGDRARVPHAASLFDLEMKYTDVVDAADVVAYLDGLR